MIDTVIVWTELLAPVVIFNKKPSSPEPSINSLSCDRFHLKGLPITKFESVDKSVAKSAIVPLPATNPVAAYVHPDEECF